MAKVTKKHANKVCATKAAAVAEAKKRRAASGGRWGVVHVSGEYRVRVLTSKTNKSNIVFAP